MIDIHSHILPQIDDGAQDLAESVEMAKLAVSEGITDIIATPHHANGKWMNEADQVVEAVQLLNLHLADEGIPLIVHPGQEIRVYPDLIDDYQTGKLLRLNHSPYMLLELPSSNVPTYMEDLLHECSVAGIIPVIAHPERNRELAANPRMLHNFIELGALTQVTSHSINGLFGSTIQKLSLSWCRSNLVHFIASDAHNSKQRNFQLGAAYRRIDKELGSLHSRMYQENGKLLLLGNQIEVHKPIIRTKKWFFFGLR
ncbi:tyrosine-protein phosphatase [Gorillibacterium sp. sgz5001074]|uniref:tyrosine-protein phosphatase n=1 Tax=Gorillibacterium sp. sgz5001074 TaxID=3446695 RepID=UPI003F672FC7